VVTGEVHARARHLPLRTHREPFLGHRRASRSGLQGTSEATATPADKGPTSGSSRGR
jgi:hypothetical protein